VLVRIRLIDNSQVDECYRGARCDGEAVLEAASDSSNNHTFSKDFTGEGSLRELTGDVGDVGDIHDIALDWHATR